MTFRKIVVGLIAVLAVVLLGIQLIPVERTNPPVTATLEVEPHIEKILEASCYDCHSNKTKWPWYSAVAPFSWQLSHDVIEGREHLNFSEFGSLSKSKQAHNYEEIAEEVEEAKMPLSLYTFLHPGASLSEEQIKVLVDWAHAREKALRAEL